MNLGYRRCLLMALDGNSHQLRSNRSVLAQRQPQRILHGILTVTRCKLQNLQVFPGSLTGTVLAQQVVVGHAKVTRGEHVGMILVVLQGPRLAHQRLDHMSVVDRVFAIAQQARHGLNSLTRAPDFNLVGVDDHIDLHANQTTGHRVRVPLHLNRTAAVDLDIAHAVPMVEFARRQLAQAMLLFAKLIGPPRVSFAD